MHKISFKNRRYNANMSRLPPSHLDASYHSSFTEQEEKSNREFSRQKYKIGFVSSFIPMTPRMSGSSTSEHK